MRLFFPLCCADLDECCALQLEAEVKKNAKWQAREEENRKVTEAKRKEAEEKERKRAEAMREAAAEKERSESIPTPYTLHPKHHTHD